MTNLPINQILCGDSLSILESFPSNSIHCIITSPPYWDRFKYSSDSLEIGQQLYPVYLEKLNQIWMECVKVLMPGGKIIINIGEIFFRPDPKDMVFYTHIFTDIITQFERLEMIFWGKALWCKGKENKFTGLRFGKAIYGSYPYPPNLMLTNATENLLVFRKKGKRNPVSLKIKEKSEVSKEFIREFTKPIWFISPISAKRKAALSGHPAVFPEEIPARFIRAYTFVNDIVLDPFCGSGTTCLAAKKLERNYIGIDLKPAYCRMSRHRIADLTP